MTMKKHFKIILILIVLAIILFGSGFILAVYSDSPLAVSLKRFVPYKIVGSNIITELDRYHAESIAKKMDPDFEPSQIYARLVRPRLI